MSKQNRKKLLLERKRIDYPINDNLFDKRDDVEVKLGISNIINQSDKVIYNDNLKMIKSEYLNNLNKAQKDAVLHSIKNGRALLLSPTGSGKSLIIYILLRYYLSIIPKPR